MGWKLINRAGFVFEILGGAGRTLVVAGLWPLLPFGEILIWDIGFNTKSINI